MLLIKRKIKRKIKRRKVSCDRNTLGAVKNLFIILILYSPKFPYNCQKKGRSFLKEMKQDSSAIIRNAMRDELLYAIVKIFYP